MCKLKAIISESISPNSISRVFPMENNKKIDGVDAQLHLPEAIIQRIQSFLSRKQAASTAAVSKSWYNSWLTRPILDFDERDFHNLPQIHGNFFNFAMRSMERYHELSLNVESFRLWVNLSDIDSSSLATELIVKAVKMGPKEVNLEFNPPISEYVLPKVLFGSESLIGLSAVGCRISCLEDTRSRLKSLCLCRVTIKDDMVRDILLKCPLLEDLVLSDCEGFEEVNVGGMVTLKNLSVIRQAAKPGRWRIPLIEFEEQSVGSVFGVRPNMSEFGKLSRLLLERVEINKMLFCDFSSKFPCIKDLTVRYCDGCVRFDISSRSLIYISLAHTKELEIQLDVPNIHKFNFSGAIIPSLSVVTASREWESDISFSCWNNLDLSWFFELKEFLTNLSLSKITLCIELLRGKHIDRLPGVQDFRKPVVENLTLRVHSLTSARVALLNGIFWSFRPKIITQCLFPVLYDKRGKANTDLLQPGYQQASNELLQLICGKLMDLESSNGCNSNEKMIGLNELEEVNAEIFEDRHMKWQPLPQKTLFDAIKSSEKEVQIRFQLRWRQLEHTELYDGQLI